MKPLPPIKIFVSYAQEDGQHKITLSNHLSALQRKGLFTSFEVGKINAGQQWKQKIQQYLAEADIVFLLLSSDAIANNYIYNEQIQKALRRAEQQDAIVIPILLRSVNYTGLGIDKYAVLPTNGKAVTSWANQDEAYTHIARQIQKVIYHLHELKSGQTEAYEAIFVNDKDAAPELPNELAEDLITHSLLYTFYK